MFSSLQLKRHRVLRGDAGTWGTLSIGQSSRYFKHEERGLLCDPNHQPGYHPVHGEEQNAAVSEPVHAFGPEVGAVESAGKMLAVIHQAEDTETMLIILRCLDAHRSSSRSLTLLLWLQGKVNYLA